MGESCCPNTVLSRAAELRPSLTPLFVSVSFGVWFCTAPFPKATQQGPAVVVIIVVVVVVVVVSSGVFVVPLWYSICCVFSLLPISSLLHRRLFPYVFLGYAHVLITAGFVATLIG